MSAEITAILPERVNSIADMVGVLERVKGLENVVVIVEDQSGVWLMPVTINNDRPTAEHINWMLDRSWILLHGLIPTNEDRTI